MILFPQKVQTLTQIRLDSQKVRQTVAIMNREIMVFPKTTQTIHNQGGLQEQADFIAYLQKTDDVQVNDLFEFTFNNQKHVAKVKETPKVNNLFNRIDVFLKTTN